MFLMFVLPWFVIVCVSMSTKNAQTFVNSYCYHRNNYKGHFVCEVNSTKQILYSISLGDIFPTNKLFVEIEEGN
jgi:hypothetical protein